MAPAVRLADLQAMTADEREDALRRLASDAIGPSNGQAVAAAARIRAFETRYEMSSAELIERLCRDNIRETAEIAEWLFWLQVERRGAGE